MKKIILNSCLTASLLIPAYGFAQGFEQCNTTKGSNNPGIFAGITYMFGDKQGLGFTLNVTSSRRDDRPVLSSGISYYPSTSNFGLPIGIGYQKSNSAVIGGYDLILGAPILQGGYSNTSKDRTVCENLEESDSRLKDEINELTVLKNGLKIYSFKYKSRDEVFVGVMAQDLLLNPKWASAVVQREDGHYLVNYSALGLKMTTLENWTKNGLNSIL